MPTASEHRTSRDNSSYRSVVDGVGMANEFLASRLGMAEYARQKGISYAVIKYWVRRARELSQASSVPVAPVESSAFRDRGFIEVASISAAGELDASTTTVRTAGKGQASLATITTTPAAIEVRLGNGVRIAIGAGFSPDILRAVIACLADRASSC